MEIGRTTLLESINQVFVYLRKTPSDTDAGGMYNRVKK